MSKKIEKVASEREVELRKYELMFILQPEMLESAVEKKLREFDKFLEENGGKVLLKDIWGKKKLAYKIGKFDQGIYVAYNVMLPTHFNKELDEYLRIEKDTIRFLLISLDEKYEYQKFEEVMLKPSALAATEEEKPAPKKPAPSNHKADDGAPKAEIKDKGKKADAGTLDDKLDKILGGGDVSV